MQKIHGVGRYAWIFRKEQNRELVLACSTVLSSEGDKCYVHRKGVAFNI